MRLRRSTVAALALLAAMNLTIAGCALPILGGGSDKSPTPSTRPAKPPRDVLAESTRGTATSAHKFTMTVGEGTAEGAGDPTTGDGKMDLTFASPEDGLKLTMSFLSVGGEGWLKIDLGRAASLPDSPKLPKQWMRLDRSKVKDTDDLEYQGDPIDAETIFDAIVEVRMARERVYVGTVDLTKAADAFMVDEDHIKALGAKASSAPFAANVDDEGRLTLLEIKVPAAGKFKAATWKGAYSDYGATIDFPKPQPGEVVEAPPAAYEIVNS